MAESSKYEEISLIEYKLREASKNEKGERARKGDQAPSTVGGFEHSVEDDADKEAESLLGHAANRGMGYANIQAKSNHQQLNTDIGPTEIDEGASLKYGQLTRNLNITRIEVNDSEGNPLPGAVHGVNLAFTKVSVIDGSGGMRVFYTRAHPSQLAVKMNTSVNHIRFLTPPGLSWFSSLDLPRLMHKATMADDKKKIATYEALMRARGTAASATGAEHEERLRALRNIPLTVSSGDFAQQSFYIADNSGKRYLANQATAISQYWNNERDTDNNLRANRIERLRDAYEKMRIGGGVAFGVFKDNQGSSRMGFRVFNAGYNDKVELREPIKKYLEAKASIEAEFLGEDYAAKDRMVKHEIENLRSLYRRSNNEKQDGMIDMDILAAGDVAPKGMEGDVSIAPSLLAVADSFFNKVVNQDVAKRHTSLTDMGEAVSDVFASVKELRKNEIDFALEADTEVKKAHNASFQARQKEWKNVLVAYDPHNMTGITEDKMESNNMLGWTRLSKLNKDSSISAIAELALIPPSVSPGERALIIADYTHKDYEATSGNRVFINNILHELYDPKTGNHHTAKIVIRANGSALNVSSVVGAAEQYLAKQEGDPEIDTDRHTYGFDVYRTPTSGKTEIQIAKDNLMTYLTDQAKFGESAKAYQNMTREMTRAFTDIYAGSMNTNTELSRTLMDFGPILLPEEGITVVFGPSGGLYKVHGADGPTQTIEEIPARAFSHGSLYMKVVGRLSNLAKTGEKSSDKIRFKGNDAFNFAPGSIANRAFVDWSDKILDNMEEFRLRGWAKHLRGVAMYSRLQGMLKAGFVKPTQIIGINSSDAERLKGRYKIDTSEAVHISAIDKTAEQAYNDVVEYVQTIYGEDALHEESFVNKYHPTKEVREAIQYNLQQNRARLIENLTKYADGWKQLEIAMDRTVAGVPGSKKLVKTIYELERERMQPSIISTLIRGFTDLIGKVYAKFVEGLSSVFDLLNPVSILNSLHKATYTTVLESVNVLFSNLFTNFLDIHFKNAPVGKSWAKDVFDKVGVKILNTHERRIMARIQGSNQLALVGDDAQHKHNALQTMFTKPVAGVAKRTAYEQDAFNSALTSPELSVPRGGPGADWNNDQFDIVYSVTDPASFKRQEALGEVEFETLSTSREALERWWKKKGFGLLFPVHMELTSGDPGRVGVNLMTPRLYEQARNANAANFVSVSGNDIRVKLKLGMFDLTTNDIWGNKSDVKRANRAFLSTEEESRKVAAREFKRKQSEDEYARVPRMKRRANVFGSISKNPSITSDIAPDSMFGKVPYDAMDELNNS